MRVLIVNAGSSSVKLSVLEGDDVVAEETLPAERGGIDPGTLTSWVASVGRVDAVGHRIVHGGSEFLERWSSTSRSLHGCAR